MRRATIAALILGLACTALIAAPAPRKAAEPPPKKGFWPFDKDKSVKADRIECKEIVIGSDDGAKVSIATMKGTAGIWLQSKPDDDLIAIYSTNGQTAIGIYDKKSLHSTDGMPLALTVSNGVTVLQYRDSAGTIRQIDVSALAAKTGKRCPCTYGESCTCTKDGKCQCGKGCTCKKCPGKAKARAKKRAVRRRCPCRQCPGCCPGCRRR